MDHAALNTHVNEYGIGHACRAANGAPARKIIITLRKDGSATYSPKKKDWTKYLGSWDKNWPKIERPRKSDL